MAIRKSTGPLPQYRSSDERARLSIQTVCMALVLSIIAIAARLIGI
jgi:hypothetical protein